MNEQRLVVYVGVCGSPASAGTLKFVEELRDNGYQPCVIATPSGAKFIDAESFESVTGFPVRADYKHPLEPDVLPTPDVLIIAPATFNTVNKIANGITDTLIAGIACECLGAGKPTIIAPALNDDLSRNLAYKRSVLFLREQGARVIDDRIGKAAEPVLPRGRFSWDAIAQAFAEAAKVEALVGGDVRSK